jgi:4-amino-4-deoxy-L-arabinose transferase-like glycosyltransferase
MLILSFILYLLTAFVVSIYLFDKISWGKLIIVLFILSVAANTLIFQLLSLFNHLNSPWLFLTLQLILLIALLYGVTKFDRKSFTQKVVTKDYSSLLPKWEGSLFITLTVILLGVLFVIGKLGVVNNLDSLHTHLPRIYYWLQHNNLADWNPTVLTQVSYPLIPSIQGAYFFLLGGTDNLFFLVHWASLVTCLASVFEITRSLGASRRQASITLLITLSFPVIMLQTFSLQGDLFLAALLVSAVYFIVLFQKEHNETYLALSTLPVAISLGSKQTALLFIPMYLFFILLLIIKKNLRIKKGILLLVLLLVGFLAFSSLKYFQKMVWADLEGNNMYDTLTIGGASRSENTSIRGYSINLFRYLYQATSIEGLSGGFYNQALAAKNDASVKISNVFGLDLEEKAYIPENEDTYFDYDKPQTLSENSAWFGPLSILLFPAILVSVLLKKNKMARNYAFFAIALILIFFFSLVFFKDGWGPNRGRYLIPAVIIFIPLTFLIFPANRILQNTLLAIIALISIVLSANTLVFNNTRLLLNQNQLIEFREKYVNNIKVTNFANSLYRRSLYLLTNDLIITAPQKATYLGQNYYGKLFYESRASKTDAEFVEQSIKPDQRIYTKIEDKIIEFSLFGINRTREVMPFIDFSEVASGSYVVIAEKYLPVPSNYQLINTNGSIDIFYVP